MNNCLLKSKRMTKDRTENECRRLQNRHDGHGLAKDSKGDEWRELSLEEIRMGFVASCIEDVADKLGVDYSEIYRRMNAVGLIDQYVMPYYEMLHTESRENVTQGMIETLQRWEEKK